MYKAYLYDKKVNKPKEIRRFSVDHDVSSCYEYLRKKVASVFPDLSEENFNLQWQDSDGDLIWFNSDEELIEALSEHQGGIFKLLIKEKSNDPDTTNDDKDESETEESAKKCGGRGGRGKWWGKRGSRGGYWCSYPGYQQQMFNQMFAQQGCPKKDNGNDGNNETSGPANDGPQAFPSGEEYLKNVGSAVSEFLKPFGIDVDVSVDHNGVRTSCKPRNPPKEGDGKDEEKPTCSKNADGNSATQSAAETDEKSETTPTPPSPFTIPVKVVHEDQMKKEAGAKQDKQGGQSSDEGEWTLVKDEDGKPSTSEEKKEKKDKEESSNKNDSNGSSSGLPRQPGPLDLLLAMGFKDENGSLARLLQACQNDIGKVLENMEKMNLPK